MAKATLLNKVKKTSVDAGVTGNGVYHLYTSSKIPVNAGDNAVEIVIKYENNTPDPSKGVLASYNLSVVVETEDDSGNWHPIHYQFDSYVNPEDGNQFILKLDPTIFQLDEGVSNAISNGANIIAKECKKQGTLPDDFRVCVLVNEFGYVDDGNGGTVEGQGSFKDVELSLEYNTYSV